MIRLLAASVVLVAIVAACASVPDGVFDDEPTSTPPPLALPPPTKKPAKQKPTRTRMLVTVVDGDTHRRVKGARVVIGKRADYANPRGLAAVKIKHRTALKVRISKPSYATRTVRMPFKQRRQVTARLYRDALQ